MIEALNNFSTELGTARNQHRRGTCLAFASSDFNRHTNAGESPLSAEYLAHHAVKQIPNWKAGDGLNVPAALAALKHPGQPIEESYAYDPLDHGRPLQAVPSDVGALYTSEISKQRLTANAIVDIIKGGKPVCLVIALSQYFMKPDAGIVKYGTDYVPNALHAVVGVGVGVHTSTNETHVLVRNSWGESWGQSGHAWLPRQYLNTHLNNSFAL
jgi:C1A family cysteine protease